MNRVELASTILDFAARYVAAGDAELAAACRRVAADVAREVPGGVPVADRIAGPVATCPCGRTFHQRTHRQKWCREGCRLGEEKRKRDGAPEMLGPVYRALGRLKEAIWEREEQQDDLRHQAPGGGPA